MRVRLPVVGLLRLRAQKGSGPVESKAPASSSFDQVVSGLWQREGGYNPRDPISGAEVNFGIDKKYNPDVDVANLTQDKAKELYRKRYWDTINGDALPKHLAPIIFDASVNQGPGYARDLLKRSDGDLQRAEQLRREDYIKLAEADPSKKAILPVWLQRTKETAEEGFSFIPTANAANTALPAKTGIASAPQSDAVEGSPLTATGIAATAAAAGTPAVLRRVNEARRAADIAKLAGGQPIPPGSVVPSSAMRPPVTVGSLAKQVIPTKVGIGSLGTAGLIGAAGYDIASNMWDTPTEEYYRRLGIEPPANDPDKQGSVALLDSNFWKDVGVRGVGALEEGLSTLTGGYYGQARGFRRPQAASTTAPPAPPAPPAPTAAPRAAPAAEVGTAAKKPSMLDSVGEELFTRIKNERLPETEDQYNARHDKIAKDLGVDPASTKKFFEDQAGKFTEQAAQARQDRDVNLWMSAAQGFFAMAGGTSPHAMKNFADGLGVGTKQMTGALREYKGIERDITKNQREMEKLQMSTNMGHAEKKSERMDKFIGRQEMLEVRKTTNLQNLYNTMANREQTQEAKARRMTETERYNKAREEAKQEDQRRQNLVAWGKYKESEEYRGLLNDVKKAGTNPQQLALANRALIDKKAEYLGSGGGQSAGASSNSTWGKPEIIKP
jgi:hypothetical protein